MEIKEYKSWLTQPITVSPCKIQSSWMTAFHQPGDLYDFSLFSVWKHGSQNEHFPETERARERRRHSTHTLYLLYFPSECSKAFCSPHCTDLCLTASPVRQWDTMCVFLLQRIVCQREINTADWPDIHQLKIIVCVWVWWIIYCHLHVLIVYLGPGSALW